MTVYVDNWRGRLGSMVMCHVISDTQKELLEMADKLGIAKKWIQHSGTSREHFDICLSKRKRAIQYGAIEINFREYARRIRLREEEGEDFAVKYFSKYISSNMIP